MESNNVAHLYDKIASWWDNQHKESDYGITSVERAILYCTNKREALDIGCGSGGRIINALQNSGFTITGVDCSIEMIRLAKEKHPSSEFNHADIREWNSTRAFDCIVAWDSIFHVPAEDHPALIEKMCSLLQPEGILIYTFGTGYGNHSDLSFLIEPGKQIEPLHNDYFPYGTIGIEENIRILHQNNCTIQHLELDQYPANHVVVIAKKNS